MSSAPPSAAAYRRDAALLAAVIAVVLAITFAPYVFAGRTLLSSAAEVPSIYVGGATPHDHLPRLRSLDPAAPGFQSEPWAQIQHRIVVDEHRLPFWDPYDGYGAPFDAAMQPQPFYPLTALFALHPTARAYTWFVLARLFVAGWFAALFLRLFADKYAAAVAGIATTLTGYYLLYYNIPHLSVDVGLPMLLWATELVLRRRSPARIGTLGAAAALAYLGGMPETAFLALAVAALYAAVRIAAARDARLSRAFGVVAGHACGLAAGAVAVVPFLEYVGRSFNSHQAENLGGAFAGLAADPEWHHSLLTEFAPLVFGYPWSSILTAGAGHGGVRGFFGCAVALLAFIAVGAALRRRDERTPIVLLFVAIAGYCILKRYGNPLVQWTGTLPALNAITFPKYLEFCLGDAAAILAGFGVAALREGRAGARLVVAAFAGVLAILSFLEAQSRGDVPTGPLAWQFPFALIVALLALGAAAALAYAIVRGSQRVRALASAALCALVLGEISAGYTWGQLWIIAPPLADDPYAGAPYLSYLDRHVDRTRERTFGVSGILFPNWPGAYGLADVRALNALIPRDYIPFVDAFITRNPAKADDQHDRFTAVRPLVLSTPLARRWLRMSSVRWLLSPSRMYGAGAPPGAFLSDLWDQTAETLPTSAQAAIHPTTAVIGGSAEEALFQHPPYGPVVFATRVPRDRPVAVADVALDPATYVPPAHVCGGAVTFTLTAERAGRVVARAQRTIDPKHVAAERRWIPLPLDLSRAAGAPVTLRFETAAPDACTAWALWGEPRFAAARDTAAPRALPRFFSEAFGSPEAYVYDVPGALDRLTVVHAARVAPDRAAALAVLTSPAFDPAREAVVDEPVGPLEPRRATERVTVTQQRSDEVIAEVTLGSTGLLVQNDTFYPGWVATVDGNPARIVRADVLFRGIVLPAGKHVVTIAYRSTAARAGTDISAVGLFALVALLGAPLVARRRSVDGDDGRAEPVEADA